MCCFEHIAQHYATPTHPNTFLPIGDWINNWFLGVWSTARVWFFYFITFGHRLLATIIKNGGHDSDFIYLPLTTSIDMPHILRSKPASNTSGRTLSHGGCYHLSHVEQESNFPCISFFFASPSLFSARYSNHCFFSRRQRWGMMMRSVLSPQTNPNCSI